jgi:hypothetical protein
MIRNFLLAVFLVFFAVPVFAAGPDVLDTTKEDEVPVKPDELIAHGTIKAACAPWQDGLSVGIELDNHVGLTLYMAIDSLADRMHTDFKAQGDTREAGSAVIFRCDAEDKNCNQVNGSVTITLVKNPLYAGRYVIEGEEPKHFEAKRLPSSAKCDG